MSIQQQNNDSPDLDRIDAAIQIGLIAWEAFRKSTFGKTCLDVLPSAAVYRRANELFLLGFTARLTTFPPFENRFLDDLLQGLLTDALWDDYLKSAGSKIILDGPAYPDTPECVLEAAKGFFRIGLKSATIACRELEKSQ